MSDMPRGAYRFCNSAPSEPPANQGLREGGLHLKRGSTWDRLRRRGERGRAGSSPASSWPGTDATVRSGAVSRPARGFDAILLLRWHVARGEEQPAERSPPQEEGRSEAPPRERVGNRLGCELSRETPCTRDEESEERECADRDSEHPPHPAWVGSRRGLRPPHRRQVGSLTLEPRDVRDERPEGREQKQADREPLARRSQRGRVPHPSTGGEQHRETDRCSNRRGEPPTEHAVSPHEGGSPLGAGAFPG